MTTEELLTHEVSHRYSGNGYAVVEICPPSKSSLTGAMTEYCRVTDKWCKFGQAFLAAVDHLTVSMKFPGVDPDGKPYPPEPILLTDEELEKLKPLRDGISDGSMKVVSTHFVKPKQPQLV